MPYCNDGGDTSYGSGSDSGNLLSDFNYCRTNVSSFYSTCWFMVKVYGVRNLDFVLGAIDHL
jgi:hypothetical protein